MHTQVELVEAINKFYFYTKTILLIWRRTADYTATDVEAVPLQSEKNSPLFQELHTYWTDSGYR